MRTIFEPSRDAGDDGLHLVRRQLLRLVEDEKPARDGTAADESQRLDLDESALEQALVGFGDAASCRGRRCDEAWLGCGAVICATNCSSRCLCFFLETFLRGELRFLRRLGGNEHLQRVVVGCSHGFIFSSSVPGRKPMSLPSAITGREMDTPS
jgi:hypothetical protein